MVVLAPALLRMLEREKLIPSPLPGSPAPRPHLFNLDLVLQGYAEGQARRLLDFEPARGEVWTGNVHTN